MIKWFGKGKLSFLPFFVTQENDSYREYCLPFGWKKTGYLRQNGKTWDFFAFSPNGKKFRSTVEVNRYLDQNPDVQCDRSVTNTLKPSDLTSPKSNGMVHNCRKDNSFVKVQIFWDGQNILKKISNLFWLYLVKLGHSEKATKIWKNFTLDLTFTM